jgi:putative peptidoglycan lipid II flippase
MSLTRDVATVGAATLASRLFGFLRDVLIAAALGAGAQADAFFVAFQLPNLARRLLAEGALNAALVPLYLRARDEGGATAAADFAGRITATLTLLLVAAAAALALAMPLVMLALAPGFADADPRLAPAIAFARLMLPYVVLAGPAAVVIGLLNASSRFAAAALAPVLFNTVLAIPLVALLLAPPDDPAGGGHLLAAAVGAAGLAQLIMLAAALRPRGGGVGIGRLRVSFDAPTRKFLALALPGLIGAGIPQLTLIVAVMVASGMPNAVSWLYYANRLIELPLGVVGMAVGTVLVTSVVQAVRRNDRGALIAAQSRGLELALGLALPAAIALALLADPIVAVLFEHGAFTPADSRATSAALAALAAGLPAQVLVKAVSPAFYAREDTATPMWAAACGLATALAGSLALAPSLGHVGIALAVALSGWATAAVLGVVLRRRIGFALDPQARRRLPRIALAAAVMGASLLALRAALGPVPHPHGVAGLVQLAALIAAGLAVYLALIALLGVARLREIAGAIRRPPPLT